MLLCPELGSARPSRCIAKGNRPFKTSQSSPVCSVRVGETCTRPFTRAHSIWALLGLERRVLMSTDYSRGFRSKWGEIIALCEVGLSEVTARAWAAWFFCSASHCWPAWQSNLTPDVTGAQQQKKKPCLAVTLDFKEVLCVLCSGAKSLCKRTTLQLHLCQTYVLYLHGFFFFNLLKISSAQLIIYINNMRQWRYH